MFCEKLKEIRKENGKTQKDIAKVTGYQQTLVSKWELGEREPSFEALKKISKYFNTSIDTLLENNLDNNINEKIFAPYQKEIIDYIKSMNELECFQVKTYIETLKKMQTDKEQARELYNILKRNI